MLACLMIVLTLASTHGCGRPKDWYEVVEEAPDPKVVTDAAIREAIKATGLPWRVKDKATGIEMLLIPSGTFRMGCSIDNPMDIAVNQFPVHEVTLTRPIFIGRTEVTQAQWQAQTGRNPSAHKDASRVEVLPVESVTWNDVQAFCSKTGLRLPTEAEWEFACRGGTSTHYHGTPQSPAGSNNFQEALGEIAWFKFNSGGSSQPVASKAPNGFGLYDMTGNVLEWVQDFFGPYSPVPQTDPTGPRSEKDDCRVLRGGGWNDPPWECMSSARSALPATMVNDQFGFRVVQDP